MKDFGWQPRVSVVDGVSRLVDWLDQNKFLFDVSGKVASPAVLAAV
jgi:hypothetical protein